jgi:hypothetical protein
VAEKQCSRCREVKPWSDFAADRTTVDGRRGSCRECAALARVELRERWLEKVSIYRIIAIMSYGGVCECCSGTSDLDFVLSRDSLLVVRDGDDVERQNARHRLVARIARTGVLPDRELTLLCGGCRRAAEWVPPETKRCSTCHAVKPVGEFYVDRRRTRGRYAGIQPSCKVCSGKRQRERQAQLRAARQAASRERQAVGA